MMMKTLQTKIMLSFLVLNLFIISLISFSTTRGFINISGAWAHRQSTEAAALLSEYFSENENRNFFTDDRTGEDTAVKDFCDSSLSAILVKLELWDTEKVKVFSWETAARIRSEHPKDYSGIISKLINYELSKNPESSAIKSINPIIVEGKIAGYCSSLSTPLIGFGYTSFFDKIFTSSFLTGVIISLILSVIISILLSFQISRSSSQLAGQLSDLAAGRRDIVFNYNKSSKEVRASSVAAESLQSQLIKDDLIQQRWLADITHDLKSPVTALRSQLDAVTAGSLPMNEHRLEILSGELEKLTDLIASLSELTFMKSETGFLKPETFPLIPFCEDLYNRFAAEALVKNTSLNFNLDNAPETLTADRELMTRVFNNLISNALMHSDEGFAVNLRIYKAVSSVIIEIENKGCIGEEDLQLIFNRLYRGSNTKKKGSGLGLNITKTIVEKHHGKITAFNTNHGTVIFRVSLPDSVN